MKRRFSGRTWCIIFVVVVFFGLPTVHVASCFGRTAFALVRADHVELEEFLPEMPFGADSKEVSLQKRELSRAEFWRVAYAVPPVPDGSLFVIKKLCMFDPHHRITVARKNETLLKIDVCFHCSEIRFGGGGVMSFPMFWHGRLLTLFQRYGIPDRGDGYHSLRNI